MHTTAYISYLTKYAQTLHTNVYYLHFAGHKSVTPTDKYFTVSFMLKRPPSAHIAKKGIFAYQSSESVYTIVEMDHFVENIW